MGDEAMLMHTGWCLKRVREIINSGPDEIPITKNLNEKILVFVQKVDLLNMITFLGQDVMQILCRNIPWFAGFHEAAV